MEAAMSNEANNFYTSDQITVEKVAFQNQYRMKAAGHLFAPKNLDWKDKHNLYATKMAEQGFVTLSLDLSFRGESCSLFLAPATLICMTASA
jgi:hypothetical protein